MTSDIRTFKERLRNQFGRTVVALPYAARRRRADGGCKRCNKIDTVVIESVTGGWLCWDLGYCQVRKPFPSYPDWNPPVEAMKATTGVVDEG